MEASALAPPNMRLCVLLKYAERFAQANDGATAIEYALIASFISLLVVTGATGIGINLDAIFQVLDAALN